MNHSRAWGLSLALLMVGAVPTWATEPPMEGAAAQSTWYQRLFGGGSGNARVARASAAEPTTTATSPTAANGTLRPAEQAANLRNSEEQNYLRRVAVCDKLREMALVNQDPELEKKANELEAQAWEVYRRRTIHLPVSRLKTLEAEQRLEKRLQGSTPVTAKVEGKR